MIFNRRMRTAAYSNMLTHVTCVAPFTVNGEQIDLLLPDIITNLANLRI